MNFQIRVTSAQAVEYLQHTVPGAIARATVSALNKVAARAKTAASTKIREQYNIRKRDLDPRIKVERLSAAGAQRSGIYKVQLVARGGGIPLVLFRAQKTNKGVRVEVKVRSGKKLIPHSFMTKTMGSGEGVFLRKSAGERLVRRLPIKFLTGPSVPQLFGSEAIVNHIRDVVTELYPQIFAHELAFYNRADAPSRRNQRTR